jgi:hypothetical protein
VIKINIEFATKPNKNKPSVQVINKKAERTVLYMRKVVGTLAPRCREHGYPNGTITMRVILDNKKRYLYNYKGFCCDEYSDWIRSVLNLPTVAPISF